MRTRSSDEETAARLVQSILAPTSFWYIITAAVHDDDRCRCQVNKESDNNNNQQQFAVQLSM
jgi:hypothetical protein